MNQKCLGLGNKKSIIRELFEFSRAQKEKLGEDKVFDFSLGNPSVKPHPIVNETLKKLLDEDPTLIHGYTSAQGDKEVREVIAKHLNERYGSDYKDNNLYMTCGAAASLTITFKAIVESNDDEILAIAPYFTEYKVFVENSGAKFKVVAADENNFQINFASLKELINIHTKAIIINSPNNPSGVVYSYESLKQLTDLLKAKEAEYHHPIYIVEDEPYREIVYEDNIVTHIPKLYANTIICYSYSKSLSLPGERIGYILVSNAVEDARNFYAAICGAGRSLGYVCAPSLFQKLIAKVDGYTSNLNEYKENRDLLVTSLRRIGYQCVDPQGAFYLFMKSEEADSYAFMEKAKKYNIVLVPSDDFGIKGYVRLAYCVDKQTIINSLPAFEKLYKEYH